MSSVNRQGIQPYLMIGAVILIDIALHLTGGGIFVLDDNREILKNPTLHQSLITTVKGAPYRAVTCAVNYINYRVSGPNPQGFHITNLVLHLIAALLLFYLILESVDDKNRYWAAAIAACWFALNPVTNFCALYISARYTVLATIWTMAALLAYLKFARADKTGFLIIAFLCCILAIFSKESGIAAPMIVIVLEIIRREKAEGLWS